MVKKFSILVLLSIFLSGCAFCTIDKESVRACCEKTTNDEVVTLFSSNTNSKNKIWIGTFQLAFNDMKNNVIKKDVKFVNEEPTCDLIGLNNEEFNSTMLSEKSYYKSWGKTSLKAKNKIKRDLKRKFKTTSDVVDKYDWKKEDGKYYAYAMIKKEFEFLKAFDILENSSFNSSAKKYPFFGIKPDSNFELDNNVKVLFYENENDYAIQLLTKNNDIVYLYRTENDSDLKSVYQEMSDKTKNYKGNTKFDEYDTLKIPNLKFNKQKEYSELIGKRIEGTDSYFSAALETVAFEMNNKGGKVKSEGILMIAKTSLRPYKPRNFDFDKTFVLFLMEEGKKSPYMAVRVNDLDSLNN